MSDTIITVESLGKRYSLRHQRSEHYTTLRDVVTEKARALFQRREKDTRFLNSSPSEEFWALKDVSFEVKQGEVLGIIGRNGAGKSTLLKILSRITEPTEGKVRIKGRVASLLEVGTGFHPELTGRENIFLNGAILGMSRTEIKAKFDEIVSFAEVDKFLDTPVKRYSSGMYVRLAFAVAAHLEPEILVVDEVLAVGDAEFQNKCLGKIKDVSGGGRTVLLVSHNMQMVQVLCSRCIQLEEGHIASSGPPAQAIKRYLNTRRSCMARRPTTNAESKRLVITNLDIRSDNPDGEVVTGKGCHFTIEIEAFSKIESIRVALGIDDKMGRRIFTLDSINYEITYAVQPGRYFIECYLPALPLKADSYKVHLFVGNEYEAYDYVDGDAEMIVAYAPFHPRVQRDETHGSVLLAQQWSPLKTISEVTQTKKF